MKPEDQLLHARDIMETDVLALSPSMDVTDAVDRMLRLGISGAPVVDDDGRVVGLLSEKDLLRVLSSAVYQGLPCGRVAEHMTREVETVAPDVDVFRMTYLFHDRPYRRFVVVDDDQRMVGVLARRDLLKGLERIRREREQIAKPSTYDIMEKHRGDS